MSIVRSVFILVIILITAGCSGGGNSSTGGSTGSFSGFMPPVLFGDIIESPVLSINSSINTDIYDFGDNRSVMFSVDFNGLRKPSFFEVIIPHNSSMPISSTCLNGITSGSCNIIVNYNPSCSGTINSYIKISADNATRVFNFSGTSSIYPNKCENNRINNVTMTSSLTSHTFKNIGETVNFTVATDNETAEYIPYEAGGVRNGFYYYYKCFDNSKTCTGSVMFLGKLGKYSCYGEADYTLSIHANPFDSAGNTPAKISLYASGGVNGDKNYPCTITK